MEPRSMQDALTEAAIALTVTPPSCPEAATECVFCDIIAGNAPAVIAYIWPEAIAFTPLNPVTVGHVLIVPGRHINSPHEDPELYKAVCGRAAVFAGMMDTHYNLITNVGEEATQSIDHLHVHLLPRFHGDGLQLPWSGQYRPAGLRLHSAHPAQSQHAGVRPCRRRRVSIWSSDIQWQATSANANMSVWCPTTDGTSWRWPSLTDAAIPE